MKFLAIYKKELREALPWILAAIAIFGFIVTMVIMSQRSHWFYSDNWGKMADSPVRAYQFIKYSPANSCGPLFFFTSIGLGLALGVRQFWMPKFSKTWAFTLHRSIRREGIFFAKLASSVTAFILGLGIPWTLYYEYLTRPDIVPIPLSFRILLEGWAFVLIGILIYSGTAVSGLSRGRWFGTKMFYLIFAIIVMIIAFISQGLLGFTITIVIGLAVLLVQLFNMFMSKEF
ncbi:MAG TPA: hypothetical protein ENH94_10695 [Phycisphaerales bacterium]|nr:hypothetical protein [Phycisphaerales bacterium]